MVPADSEEIQYAMKNIFSNFPPFISSSASDLGSRKVIYLESSLHVCISTLRDVLNEQHVMKDDIVYHLQLSPPTFRLVLGHLNKVVFRVPQFCKILNRAAMETTRESFQLWKTFYRYNLCSNRSLTCILRKEHLG